MKNFIIKLFGLFGGFLVTRYITRNRPRILMYHEFNKGLSSDPINVGIFDWQVSQIKKNCTPLTLAALIELIAENKKIPNNAVVLTIDDGYENFYKLAYPILKKHGVPATFFVTTGFINGDLWLWPDKVKWILQQTSPQESVVTLNKKNFILSQYWYKNWSEIISYCLSVNEDIKQAIITSLSKQLKIEIPCTPPEPYKASNWQELQEMQDYGIEIGGHTVSHPSLTKVSRQQSKIEISNCLADITKNLGDKKRTFCYPNGFPEDYDNEIKNIVEEVGFVGAVSAFNDCHNIDIPYAWRRYVVDNKKLNFKKTIYGFDDIGNMIKKTERCDY
jgi:peptidoglycan/xylan/chitin deacetylase (PgdA/CDA1 family)